VARFYFDVHDGTNLWRDDEGSEFASLDAALQAAARSAAELGMNQLAKSTPGNLVITIEVRNEQNQRICTVTASTKLDWHIA
jgi:hypothetical protein